MVRRNPYFAAFAAPAGSPAAHRPARRASDTSAQSCSAVGSPQLHARSATPPHRPLITTDSVHTRPPAQSLPHSSSGSTPAAMHRSPACPHPPCPAPPEPHSATAESAPESSPASPLESRNSLRPHRRRIPCGAAVCCAAGACANPIAPLIATAITASIRSAASSLPFKLRAPSYPHPPPRVILPASATALHPTRIRHRASFYPRSPPRVILSEAQNLCSCLSDQSTARSRCPAPHKARPAPLLTSTAPHSTGPPPPAPRQLNSLQLSHTTEAEPVSPPGTLPHPPHHRLAPAATSYRSTTKYSARSAA